MKKIIGLFLITILVAAHNASADDSCQAQIPGKLSASLKQKFPMYRTPLVTDNIDEDVEWDVKHGGNGCLGVAKADFDGDNIKDYLLGMTSLSGNGSLVVVALTRKNSWDFHKLHSGEDGRNRLYVGVVKPGYVRRAETLDGPLESGEKKSIQCKNQGALFGTTESSGVVYCLINGKWSHSWVSD